MLKFVILIYADKYIKLLNKKLFSNKIINKNNLKIKNKISI